MPEQRLVAFKGGSTGAKDYIDAAVTDAVTELKALVAGSADFAAFKAAVAAWTHTVTPLP